MSSTGRGEGRGLRCEEGGGWREEAGLTQGEEGGGWRKEAGLAQGEGGGGWRKGVGLVGVAFAIRRFPVT